MVILLPLKMASVKGREDNEGTEEERDKGDKGQKRQGRQTEREREKATNYPWRPTLGIREFFFLYALL